jgi:hypothetical protein
LSALSSSSSEEIEPEAPRALETYMYVLSATWITRLSKPATLAEIENGSAMVAELKVCSLDLAVKQAAASRRLTGVLVAFSRLQHSLKIVPY